MQSRKQTKHKQVDVHAYGAEQVLWYASQDNMFIKVDQNSVEISSVNSKCHIHVFFGLTPL